MQMEKLLADVSKRWLERAATQYPDKQITARSRKQRDYDCIEFMAGATAGVRAAGVLSDIQFTVWADCLWMLQDAPSAHDVVKAWSILPKVKA